MQANLIGAYEFKKWCVQFWTRRDDFRDTIKSSLRKFYGGHHALVNRSSISVSQMTWIWILGGSHNPCLLYPFITYRRIILNYHQILNTTGVINVAGINYPFAALEFTPDFQWGSMCSNVLFSVYYVSFLFLYFIGIAALII